MNAVFVYGELKNAITKYILFGAWFDILPAVLGCYKYYYDDNEDFIIPCRGNAVIGQLIYLSDAELKIADIWMSDLYKRETVTILSNGKEIRAQAYVIDEVFVELSKRIETANFLEKC